MRNIELAVQAVSVESVNVEEGKKNKVTIDFDICSYPKLNNINRGLFNKSKNKLLLFGNMAEFALNNICQSSYLLIKGDLMEASEDENIFLADTIEVFREHKGKIKFKNK